MAAGTKLSGVSTSADHGSRTAILLSSFCVVAVVSIWLLNTSIYDARQLYRRGIARLEELEGMSYRARLYRAKDNTLYERLFTSWMSHWGRGYEEYNFFEKAKQFGKQAADIMSASSDIETRWRRLSTALKEAACADCTADFDEDARRFAQVDSVAGWSNVASWIVSDDRRRPILGYEIQFDGVSYTNRRTPLWQPSDEDNILVDRITAEGDKNVEAILSQEFSRQTRRLAETSRDSGRVGLSGLGVSVPVADLLFFAGPIIVGLFAVFAVSRGRETGARPHTFSFPQYHSPNDPLSLAGCSGVLQVLERTIWAGFLILPFGVVVTGLLFRYDIATPISESLNRPASVFAMAMELRTAHSVDRFLDVLNLVCAVLVLAFVYLITSSRNKHARLAPRRRISFALSMAGLTFAVTSTAFIIYRMRLIPLLPMSRIAKSAVSAGAFQSIYAFIVVLLIGSFVGAFRRLTVFTSICVLSLVTVALLLAPRLPWRGLPRW
jgi:hypothetical protein